jgi:hypothetical protein
MNIAMPQSSAVADFATTLRKPEDFKRIDRILWQI